METENQGAEDGRLSVPSFTTWLSRQLKRKGNVGALAKWVRSDHECWPRRSVNLQTFQNHLADKHLGSSRRYGLSKALDLAWAEYESFKAGGGKMLVRFGPPPLPKAAVRRHKTFMIHPDTIERVKFLVRVRRTSLGRVIDDLVEREYESVRKQAS